MCRLASFIPSEMSKDDILSLLIDMQGQNLDGFGFGYLHNDKFLVKKTHLSLTEVLTKKSKWDFFGDCFKHNSHVIFHLRKSSCGPITTNSAHPFIINNQFIGCHNGSYKSHEIIRAAMGKEIKYSSGIDSEVMLNLLGKIGPSKFNKICDDNGVYLIINRKGELCAIKNTFQGDLKIVKMKESKLDFLISEMPTMSDLPEEELDAGYYIFDKEGKLIKKKVKKSELSGYQIPCKPFKKVSQVLKEIPNSNSLPHIYQHNGLGEFKKPVKIDGQPLLQAMHYMDNESWI